VTTRDDSGNLLATHNLMLNPNGEFSGNPGTPNLWPEIANVRGTIEFDAPAGATGALTLTAASDYGPAHAHTDLHFLPTGVALSGIDAAGGGVTVHGALTLTRAQPSQADLTIAVAPGAVLAQGRANARVMLVDAPGGPNLDLALNATNAELRGGGISASDVTLNARGPVAHAPYRLAADVVWAGTPVHLQGGGVASELAQGYAATFEGAGRLRKASV
jgi:translocation and assembly module TamB